MKQVLLKRKDIDHTKFVRRSALETDFETLIKDDVIAVDADTKEVIFVHAKLPFNPERVLWALDRVKYQTNDRSRGLRTTSRIFGYSPRITYRKDFCSTTSLAVEQPAEHAAVCHYGQLISGLYSELAPEMYEQHKQILEAKVLDEWAIKETPFTSGIINKNNPLKYHFDSGNFKGVYSCMAVFKKDIRGGYLSMPEYGVGVSLPHNSVFMFEGQSVLHGVTPITKISNDATRYSIVYYSLQQIWNCLPLTDEVARIRNKKTEREQHRLAVMRGEAEHSKTLKFDNGELAAAKFKGRENEALNSNTK
jgi:hypothetical protein